MNSGNQPSDNDAFTLVDVLLFLYKKRKTFLTILLVTTIVAIAISFRIRPKYRSTVIMFPAPNTSTSRDVLNNGNYLIFGSESEAEHMMEILNSEPIINYMNKKYQLYKHYGIKDDDVLKKDLLLRNFNNNVKAKRTEFLSVQVDVLDVNADTAALMANDIANFMDSVKINMTKERAQKALEIIEREYNIASAEVKQLEDSIAFFHRLGILNFDGQLSELTQALGRVMASGNSAATKKLEDKIAIFQEHGNAFNATSQRLASLRNRQLDLKLKVDLAKTDTDPSLSFKYVITKASPSDKRHSPVRWLIVVISDISILLLTLVYYFLAEKMKKILPLFN